MFWIRTEETTVSWLSLGKKVEEDVLNRGCCVKDYVLLFLHQLNCKYKVRMGTGFSAVVDNLQKGVEKKILWLFGLQLWSPLANLQTNQMLGLSLLII